MLSTITNYDDGDDEEKEQKNNKLEAKMKINNNNNIEVKAFFFCIYTSYQKKFIWKMFFIYLLKYIS